MNRSCEPTLTRGISECRYSVRFVTLRNAAASSMVKMVIELRLGDPQIEHSESAFSLAFFCPINSMFTNCPGSGDVSISISLTDGPHHRDWQRLATRQLNDPTLTIPPTC
jgi:hypothetical protein